MSTNCLICYCENPQSPNKCIADCVKIQIEAEKSILLKHLDIIFILRNIFQVPVTQLSDYLKNCPKVDDWISICEKCNEVISGYRAIYNDLLDISRKYEETKQGIIKIVKKSYKRSTETQSDIGILNITDECRQFIINYDYQSPINPFKDGDLEALQLLNKQNLISTDDQDKPVPISKNIRSRSKPPRDHSLTISPVSSPHSYPDDDDPFSNDNDDNFEPDQVNSDDNQDDDEKSPLDSRPNSYQRHHRKETSKEWKPPTHLKYKKKNPHFKHECPHCPSQIFTNYTQLDTHFKDNHPSIVPPKQRKYPAEFYTVSESRKRRLRIRMPCKCPHCSKQLSSQDTLRTHIKFYHLRKFSFYCATCGVGKPTRKNLEKHEALCSNAEGPKEKCPEEGCSVIVPETVGLETHFRDKHPERNLISRCPECQEGFYTEMGCQRHLQRKHKETKPFKCDQCGMGYKRNVSLKNHRARYHEEEGAGKLICDHCGGSFATQKYLNDHVRMQHENMFKWRCDQCGKGFGDDEYLKIHLFKKHGIGRAEDLKWRCGVEGCGRIFWTRGPYQVHVNMHEGGKGPEYTCDECGKQFYQKFHLDYHWKAIHESKLKNEKFKCEVCEAEFGFKDYLTRHKKTVHKIFPQRRK